MAGTLLKKSVPIQTIQWKVRKELGYKLSFSDVLRLYVQMKKLRFCNCCGIALENTEFVRCLCCKEEYGVRPLAEIMTEQGRSPYEIPEDYNVRDTETATGP